MKNPSACSIRARKQTKPNRVQSDTRHRFQQLVIQLSKRDPSTSAERTFHFNRFDDQSSTETLSIDNTTLQSSNLLDTKASLLSHPMRHTPRIAQSTLPSGIYAKAMNSRSGTSHFQHDTSRINSVRNHRSISNRTRYANTQFPNRQRTI